MRRSYSKGLFLVLLAGLVLSGCAKQKAAEPAAIPTVMATANEYAFQIPDTLTAGVTTIRLTNSGKEFHHLILFRLPEGMTMGQFQQMKPDAPPPAGMVIAGGPNPAVPGGGTVEAMLNLQPGHYVAACMVPTREGIPHMLKGMMHEVTVIPGQSTAQLPEADVTITLADYKFETSKPLSAGRHVIRIDNAGPQMHELVFVKLDAGKTVEDVGKWAQKLEGPPPFTAMPGAAPMGPGASVTVTEELTAGDYVLICFVPDAKDGKPHVEHGMVQQIKVM